MLPSARLVARGLSGQRDQRGFRRGYSHLRVSLSHFLTSARSFQVGVLIYYVESTEGASCPVVHLLLLALLAFCFLSIPVLGIDS